MRLCHHAGSLERPDLFVRVQRRDPSGSDRPHRGPNVQIHVPILSFYHSFKLFSRSANVAVAGPYGYGHFRGRVLGDDTRSPDPVSADSRIHVSVNLLGGRQ